MAQNILLQISGVHKNFDKNIILKGVDLSLEKGQVISIIGSSGTGKSTLLRCINFLEHADSGTIVLDGRTIDSKAASKEDIQFLRQNTAMVFQNFNLFKNKTTVENIAEGLIVVKKIPKVQAMQKAQAMLDKLGLADKAQSYPSQLSGGQQQRVAIARALVLDPKVLLFDEPTSALDPQLVQEVLEFILQLVHEHMTMIIVTHEISFARDVSDIVCFMDEGIIVEMGPPDQVIDNPQHERTQQFLRHLKK